MIAYYFPPMGGSGVQRPLKFAKYLKRLGWEPIIIAPEPGIYHTFDDSLMRELQECTIRVERVSNRSLLSSGKKGAKASPMKPWKRSLLKWITSWFFLPDNKKGWIDDAVKRSVEIINKETISAVFATAPPYSNLIAAKRIKEETGVPVVMDLRDDWLESHLIHYPTRWHYRKMKAIEAETLTAADHLTVVNDYYNSKLRERIGRNCSPVTTIPNGFDKENFEQVVPGGDDSVFSILYSGLFYGSRRPDWFLRSVKKVMSRNPEFRDKVQLRFQGGLDQSHWKTINRLGLTDLIMDFGYLEHQEAIQNLVNADLLFLTLGERNHIDAVTPGKVFEYMGSLKPIAAFIPDGVTRKLLDGYGAARCVGIKDVDSGADILEDFFEKWKQNDLPAGDEEFVKNFERFHTSKVLAGILDQLQPAEENNGRGR